MALLASLLFLQALALVFLLFVPELLTLMLLSVLSPSPTVSPLLLLSLSSIFAALSAFAHRRLLDGAVLALGATAVLVLPAVFRPLSPLLPLPVLLSLLFVAMLLLLSSIPSSTPSLVGLPMLFVSLLPPAFLHFLPFPLSLATVPSLTPSLSPASPSFFPSFLLTPSRTAVTFHSRFLFVTAT
ncbi:hypothetical protein GCM10009000_014040 [Halobacterium noricense]|uniref:Uncharacterized protein n=1 Tax=Haladaptatus pallidirubidus TaxID=1008152 RepID=A0AAV3UBJ9_9EURY